MWRFVKAKFKVGDVVRFPYGRRIGKIKAVGEQVMEGIREFEKWVACAGLERKESKK